MENIAVLTSGGDAPGMNAAIRAVVRTGIYHGLTVYGIRQGYEGLLHNNITPLTKSAVGNIIHRGGTILKTSRSDAFRTADGRRKAYEVLQNHGIEGLICIGGNGTYTGAEVFSSEYPIKVIGVPGTIDNDIYGTDFTIGFDTAVNTAIDAIDKIRDTADSHDRLFFIEVMGRHAGFIGLNAGIASGAGDLFLPETANDVDTLINRLNEGSRRKKLFNLVIVAEGHKEGGALAIVDRVQRALPDFDAKVTILGHLQRGGSPTGADRVLASRLGYAAVEALIDGKTQVAMGTTDGHISYTPLSDAITKQNNLDKSLIKMANILAS